VYRAELGFIRQAPQHRTVVHDRRHVFQPVAQPQAIDRGRDRGQVPNSSSPRIPERKGVNFLVSQVSVWATPPGSQMKITASALARERGAAADGPIPAQTAPAAARPVLRNSRRGNVYFI